MTGWKQKMNHNNHDFKIGDKVRFMIDVNGIFNPSPFEPKIGTIIGKDCDGTCLIGWNENEFIYNKGWKISKNIDRLQSIVEAVVNLTSFTHAWWSFHDATWIMGKVKTNLPTKVNGYACTRCGDYVHQAEPNQPNGKFKCYSCRNNPYR